MSGSVVPLEAHDLPALAALYARYVECSAATFHLRAPSPGAWAAQRSAAAALPWLAWREAGELFGAAYAVPWKPREAYAYSVEVSVYVRADHQRRGIGGALLAALLAQLRARPVRTVLAGIVLPNPASVALHEKLGFEPAGVLREVGFKFDRWHDVGYWQLTLPFEPPADG